MDTTGKLLLAACLFVGGAAYGQLPGQVGIVGIGATTCGEFVEEAKANPAAQRSYLAWLQGYMSGLVVGSPKGTDEGTNLNPKSFPLPEQLKFIRDFCLNDPSANFADAVEELYRRLKKASTT